MWPRIVVHLLTGILEMSQQPWQCGQPMPRMWEHEQYFLAGNVLAGCETRIPSPPMAGKRQVMDGVGLGFVFSFSKVFWKWKQSLSDKVQAVPLLRHRKPNVDLEEWIVSSAVSMSLSCKCHLHYPFCFYTEDTGHWYVRSIQISLPSPVQVFQFSVWSTLFLQFEK